MLSTEQLLSQWRGQLLHCCSFHTVQLAVTLTLFETTDILWIKYELIYQLLATEYLLCTFSSKYFGLTCPSSGAKDVTVSLHMQHMVSLVWLGVGPEECVCCWRVALLLTYYFTSINTKLVDILDQKVIIIVATDDYTSFLSVSVWISLACIFLCSQGGEGRGRTKGFGILSQWFLTLLTDSEKRQTSTGRHSKVSMCVDWVL